MPAMAAAALLRTPRSTWFRPAISTTEYINVMSVSSTMGPVSPLAIVDTINLGNPIGSASLMTVAASDVPPDPPADIMPSMKVPSKLSNSSFTSFVAQPAITLITSPRGRSSTAFPLPYFSISLLCVKSIASCSVCCRPTSINVTPTLGSASSMAPCKKSNSSSFVSQVPRRTTCTMMVLSKEFQNV